MSTILEALKKSERERKLSDLPTLSDMPAMEEPSPFKWIGLTLLGLAIVSVLAAVIVMVFMSSEAPSRAVSDGVLSPVDSVAQTTLSVLSYSESANQRFAIINEKLVREGDFLSTGIKVEEIQLDRVILNVRGERMSLQP